MRAETFARMGSFESTRPEHQAADPRERGTPDPADTRGVLRMSSRTATSSDSSNGLPKKSRTRWPGVSNLIRRSRGSDESPDNVEVSRNFLWPR